MSASGGWSGGWSRRPEGALANDDGVESVSQLTGRLRHELAQRFAHVGVRGEIGEWTRASSGHVYFSLKDATARLSAVIWRSAAARLAPRDLAVGTEVIAHGRIDVYAPRGTYALQVERLAIAGRGDLHARFEQLKATLRARGWFDPERKRPLPRIPRSIGVVTSPGGAALHDFLETLLERFPCVAVAIHPARVQGEGAAAEIAAAVRALDRRGGFDVIVVTRGGGSLEDLWAFNEEPVARAIFECSVPVVSGVGHETDITIADLVADVRAKTPTEAAVLIAPRRADLLAELDRLQARAWRAVRERLDRARREVEALAAGRALGRPELEIERWRGELAALALRGARAMRARTERGAQVAAALEQRLRSAAPRRRLAADAQRLTEAGVRLERAIRARGARAEERLAGAAGLLDAHSPVQILARGFSVAVRAGKRQPLTSVASLAVGELLETAFLDGRALSRVERIEPQESLAGAVDATPASASENA
ncbi:MAG: exodeoxyribonuclease VII large subunit [Planctomycetes bacterium]|nr:exodeoxyribonuclease VII large subunit [Planctomycetota bacterium]